MAAALLLSVVSTSKADAQSLEDLKGLSIDQLANVQVYSVAKQSQSLSGAPAAVYVITHDDIVRSGAMTLPEILRLAPNLQVAQISADNYAISARGFNGNAADKLLVLIDGRSVYTPLYGGVFWDEKTVLPEDIERIEVISGPGATLWGANAVNGVINIITRKSSDTQGGVASFGIGNRERRGSLQYGGALADDLSYRAYLEAFSIDHDKTTTGANAEDGWTNGQAGFRVDWTPQNDSLTVQGDYYRGAEDVVPTVDLNLTGGNFQATWQHHFDDGSSLQVLGYYDGARRYSGQFGFSLNTYDIEAQHSFSLNAWNDFVWGGGLRVYQDQFDLTGNVLFLPASRTQSLTDIFGQDTMTLMPSLKLTLGMKLEDDPYSGLAPLPSGRLAWTPNSDTLFWAAISRAVRAPTRFDTDLYDAIAPGILILTGNRDFQPEKLDAYEIGTRVKASDALSFSISAYYNVYTDLRSIEWANMTTLPLLWTYGNNMEGDTYGIEAWADYQLTDWWRLSAGLNLLHEDLRFKPGSSALGGVQTAGNDPPHQGFLRSSMDLLPELSWDADLRVVGQLPNPKIPSYAELNSRLAWQVSKSLEISLVGFDLLHKQHLEYEEAGATIGDEVERSVLVETRVRF
jgi:iron complex outermembrane receptor protein